MRKTLSQAILPLVLMAMSCSAYAELSSEVARPLVRSYISCLIDKSTALAASKDSVADIANASVKFCEDHIRAINKAIRQENRKEKYYDEYADVYSDTIREKGVELAGQTVVKVRDGGQ
jgi:thiaminase